jgi:holo-[acyl-carrier protein] synthase
MDHRTDRNVNTTATDIGIRIGLDLVPVRSIEAALADHGERYLERIYTATEIADCMRPSGPDPVRLAGRFAVKEATLKVLPASAEGLSFRTIELVWESADRPRVVLHGRAAELAAEAGIGSLSVSLSGDRDLATAVVVAELIATTDREAVALFPTAR